MTLAAAATELRHNHGPDGLFPADGHEDDFGDLVREAWMLLGGPEEDQDLYDHFQSVACASQAISYEAWLAPLAAVLDIYYPCREGAK